MSGEKDQIKGRVKEAAGVLINDRKMKNAGRVDQKVGDIKQVVGRVIDKARNAIKKGT